MALCVGDSGTRRLYTNRGTVRSRTIGRSGPAPRNALTRRPLVPLVALGAPSAPGQLPSSRAGAGWPWNCRGAGRPAGPLGVGAAARFTAEGRDPVGEALDDLPDADVVDLETLATGRRRQGRQMRRPWIQWASRSSSGNAASMSGARGFSRRSWEPSWWLSSAEARHG